MEWKSFSVMRSQKETPGQYDASLRKPKTKLPMTDSVMGSLSGAGEGSRTLVLSLEG